MFDSLPQTRQAGLCRNGVSFVFLAAATLLLGAAAMCQACPFCSAASQTLSEEIQAADAVVLAKLLHPAASEKPAEGGFGAADPNTGTAKFEIVEVLHGKEVVGDTKEIDVVFFGEPVADQVFMVTGIGREKLDWTTPLPLTATAIDYVRQLSSIATSGADRLAFFQEYFENDDPLLAQDAYDEFARAPYSELIDLKARMPHDRLIQWIEDPAVNPNRRRLYLTMLGVCGSQSDVPLLEAMIVSDFEAQKPLVESLSRCGLALGGPIGLSAWPEMLRLDERRKKLGLDALLACYLVLRGGDGLDLVDSRFLTKPQVEYTYIYCTIMALRFLGDESTTVVPRERLLRSMRLLLDNPDFADQVIPDLSRWDDWEILDRLVSMYKSAESKSFVRQPIVTYLTVASEQPGEVGERAKTAMTELEQLDPEGVKKAKSMMAFGFLARARAATNEADTTKSKGEGAAAGDSMAAQSADTAAGFGASAQDAGNASEADASQIPDPATFGQQKPAGRNPGEGSDVPDDERSADEPSVTTGDTTAAAETHQPAAPTTDSKTPAIKPSVNSAPAIASSATSTSEPHTVLVIGVPLAAVLLLTGVYWLILRSGAV